MRESIVIEIALVRAMQIEGSLTGDWHAATAGAEHGRLAASSVLPCATFI